MLQDSKFYQGLKFVPQPAYAYVSGAYFYPASKPTVPVTIRRSGGRIDKEYCRALIRCNM